MKKIFITILIVFLLVVNVKASAFAIIGMQGLQLVSPEAAKAVSTVLCITNPIVCAEGKVVGYVAGEAVQALAEVSPEAAKAVVMANQIKGYVDEGAAIVNEIQLNENGEVIGGSIKIGKEQSIGNLMNSQFDKDAIKIADSEYSVENGAATVMVGENGYVKIKDKASGLGYSYENIKKGGLIKLDNNGKVTEADFAAKEGGGSYAFGTDVVKVPENARVIYKNGEVKVIAKEGDVIETSQIIEQGKQTIPRRINILKDGDITVNGNKVYGENFIVDSRLKVVKGSVVLEKEGIIVGENTNAFADKIRMNIETNRYQSVMFYNEGSVPCKDVCYPSYILPGTNGIEMSSRDIDGFYVGFEDDNPYTGKEFSYVLKGGYGEVKILREGDTMTSVVNTGEDGIVKYSSGNQKLEFQNGEVYSSTEDAVIRLNDPNSNLNTEYRDISIKSFSDGSTDFCSSSVGATGFIVLDLVTGSATDVIKCVATSQGKRDVIIDIQVDEGYGFGVGRKVIVNTKKISPGDFKLRGDGLYEYEIDTILEKDAQGYNVLVYRKLLVDPNSGSLEVKGFDVKSKKIVDYDITTGPKSLFINNLKVLREELGLPAKIDSSTCLFGYNEKEQRCMIHQEQLEKQTNF